MNIRRNVPLPNAHTYSPSAHSQSKERQNSIYIHRGVESAVDFMLDLVCTVCPNSPKNRLSCKESLKRKCSSPSTGHKKTKTALATSAEVPPDTHIDTLTLEPSVIRSLYNKIRTSRRCYICTTEKIEYQVVQDEEIIVLCSDPCLNKYKALRKETDKNRCVKCNVKFDASSLSFRPIFGSTDRACCSEVCFHQYNTEKSPSFMCRYGKCRSIIGRISYRWQTMEFCSIKCVREILSTIAGKCYQCQGKMSGKVVGKFTLRLGSNIRHFCSNQCRKAFTEANTQLCKFCSSVLVGDPRLFCSTLCNQMYQRMSHIRGLMQASGKVGEICDVCRCYVPDQEIEKKFFFYKYIPTSEDAFVFICSTICTAAYRQVHRIVNNICTICGSTDNPGPGIFYRTTQGILTFCNSICLVVYVCKTKLPVNCHCCGKIKTVFDSIEEFDEISNPLKYYCSIHCASLMKTSERIAKMYPLKLNYIKCATCDKISPSFIHNSSRPHQPVASYCSFFCYSMGVVSNVSAREIETAITSRKSVREVSATKEPQATSTSVSSNRDPPPNENRPALSTPLLSNLELSANERTQATISLPANSNQEVVKHKEVPKEPATSAAVNRREPEEIVLDDDDDDGPTSSPNIPLPLSSSPSLSAPQGKIELAQKFPATMSLLTHPLVPLQQKEPTRSLGTSIQQDSFRTATVINPQPAKTTPKTVTNPPQIQIIHSQRSLAECLLTNVSETAQTSNPNSTQIQERPNFPTVQSLQQMLQSIHANPATSQHRTPVPAPTTILTKVRVETNNEALSIDTAVSQKAREEAARMEILQRTTEERLQLSPSTSISVHLPKSPVPPSLVVSASSPTGHHTAITAPSPPEQPTVVRPTATNLNCQPSTQLANAPNILLPQIPSCALRSGHVPSILRHLTRTVPQSTATLNLVNVQSLVGHGQPAVQLRPQLGTPNVNQSAQLLQLSNGQKLLLPFGLAQLMLNNHPPNATATSNNVNGNNVYNMHTSTIPDLVLLKEYPKNNKVNCEIQAAPLMVSKAVTCKPLSELKPKMRSIEVQTDVTLLDPLGPPEK